MSKKGVAKGILLGLAVGLVLVCGCGKESEANNEVKTDITTIENEALDKPMKITSLQGNGTDYQAYWGTKIQSITKAENGYYYLTTKAPLFLMYFDNYTKESIKVCGKAECNHENAECNAYLGDKTYYDRNATKQEFCSSYDLYYYNGLLYVLGTEGNLISISLDGSERNKIANVYNYDASSNTKLAFYDNYVYVYNSIGNQGSSQNHAETIKRYSLDGKTTENVVEWNTTGGSINSVKNYSDKLFFLTNSVDVDKNGEDRQINYTYNGLYAYNHKTGEAGKVIDEAITGYAIDEENEKIYYFVFGEGLYVYDIKSDSKSKIYEATEEIGIADMSYDGKYIYLYNGEWTSYVKSTNKASITSKCIVLDTQGNTINTFNIDKFAYMLFGDSNYLFAEQIMEEENTGKTGMQYTYIDKSDLENGEWKILE